MYLEVSCCDHIIDATQDQFATIHPHPQPGERLLTPPRRKPIIARTGPSATECARVATIAPVVRQHRCRQVQVGGQDAGARRLGRRAGADEEGGRATAAQKPVVGNATKSRREAVAQWIGIARGGEPNAADHYRR
jgi:hypothetical protein